MQVHENSVDTDEIRHFLEEDLGSGDITSAIIPPHFQAKAEVKTRESMVLCGQDWFSRVFSMLDDRVEISWDVNDGSVVAQDTLICTLYGNARALLTGERTALNLLQTLSSTATLAREYAEAVQGTGVIILDTRKTLPGLRKAQKYAVRCGGCKNHRFGLFDGILIKENHIAAAGSIRDAVIKSRSIHDKMPIEVEVESVEELTQALETGVERILLDNFDLEMLRQAVAINDSQSMLEASGNISLDTIRSIAQTGVDYISVGALTKNITAIDISMRISLLT